MQLNYLKSCNVLPLCWITDENLAQYYSAYIKDLKAKVHKYLNKMAGALTVDDMCKKHDKKVTELPSASNTEYINRVMDEESLRGIMLQNALNIGFDNGNLLATNFLADIAEKESRNPSKVLLLDVKHIKTILNKLPLPKYWSMQEKEMFYQCFERVCANRYPDTYVGQLERLNEVLNSLENIDHLETPPSLS
ncbi:MAG: hypothetical protein LUF27_05575 [Lachnospiraceae bacterium]|nr:hypothetical protein [Lachnospiraceae bacterium]